MAVQVLSGSPDLISRDERVRRVQRIRRRAQLQALATTAGWIIGSAGLLVLAVGGLLTLH
jgi:hypothetical protein